MDIYSSDDETVEKLRKWWTENGPWILAGLLLGGASLFGWRYWVDYREQTYATASDIYEQVVEASRQGDIARAVALTVELQGLRLGTPYAEMAALAIAGQAAVAGDPSEAQLQLATLIQESRDPNLVHLARLRLARVQIAEGQYDDAAATLGAAERPGSYAPLYAELRGDLALARGDREAAAAAYREALAIGEEGVVDRALLEMKLNDLGVSVAARDA